MKITGHAFYQYSTFSALMAGDFYGSISLGELLKRGNFGLGTFHACDGEMVVVDGKAYQMLALGKVNLVPSTALSPYATVTKFVSDEKLALTNVSFSEFKNDLEARFPSRNIFYAIKATGVFDVISLRTITKQQEPFGLLKDAVQSQEHFVLENTAGQMVIIWAPRFANTICVEGFHAHFISQGENNGGHVYDFHAEKLEIEICYLTNMDLTLPTVESYLKYELDDRNLQEDAKRIE